MYDLSHHDDVLRLRLWNRASRAVGLDVSVYVVHGAMIDTGFPRARPHVERLLAEVPVRGAMITHWHEDHAGNVAMLAARGLPIALSAGTEAMLRARPRIRLYRRVTWGRPPALRSPVVPFAHPSLRLIASPGHSDDHQMVWDADRETLFTGDLWLGVRSRVMHEDEDPYEIADSLRAAAALRPRRMFDAHRGPVDDPVGAIGARIAFLEETIAAVEAKLAAGWSDRAILREVLGGEWMSAWISFGEYGRRNFVRAVRRRVLKYGE